MSLPQLDVLGEALPAFGQPSDLNDWLQGQ